MVSEAQRSRAPIQKLADKVAAYFVPAVLVVAVLTFALWSAFGPAPAMAYGIVNAVSVLIVACPCALGLATPMCIMVGTGRGARAGILIRNAEALEAFEKVDTLVVDKTGTLTEGKPRLAVVRLLGNRTEAEVLQIAGGLEEGSEHPLASAVLSGIAERKIEPVKVMDFISVTGMGVRGKINAEEVALGNRALMGEFGAESPSALPIADEMRSEGQTVMFLAIGKEIVGLIGVADPVKANAAEAIDALHKQAIRIVMVTGDSKITAQAVAKKLAIDEIHADVLPAGKIDVIKKHQSEGRFVAMAGDGINDAPALAQAQVGVAMGTGTDIAIQSSGITLVKGDLSGLVRARYLSKSTMGNIRQNLFFAFFYNVVGVPIAAGVLYPFTEILLNPMIAALAMSLSSVSVIGNALRLRAIRL